MRRGGIVTSGVNGGGEGRGRVGEVVRCREEVTGSLEGGVGLGEAVAGQLAVSSGEGGEGGRQRTGRVLCGQGQSFLLLLVRLPVSVVS